MNTERHVTLPIPEWFEILRSFNRRTRAAELRAALESHRIANAALIKKAAKFFNAPLK